MTDDELRARVERFVVEECKGRWPALSLIESLCREMIGEGLERAKDIAVIEPFRTYDPMSYAERIISTIEAEAQRVEENHDTKKS